MLNKSVNLRTNKSQHLTINTNLISKKINNFQNIIYQNHIVLSQTQKYIPSQLLGVDMKFIINNTTVRSSTIELYVY
jgi:S-adenosylmethionine synthetase